ncbi:MULTISPECIES: GlxA family transcriptional regulator [Methylomonas]|uniref:AraC family transcriptional regulator n=2 Tax=Methylomonas TaxID=416 RepID=A0A126T1Q5_9GAMM|nr:MULTISPECIES: GlxA family transcriptional regulator [Methylomonas]AMK76009.1 AraC family transcriptional regulator [Methylomonas denitrificans]OAH99857.1 AraC family transcriptional regulator [Methylomonas methanica]TCV83971.1 AraC family transcriptional regulator with amidase-like domain [Methylomonas methanica]
MTTFSFTKPESFIFKHRQIGILAFPNAQSLDITGPFEVFSFANATLKMLGICEQSIYTLKILADAPGPVKTMSGLQIFADAAYGDPDSDFDTLLIAGGVVTEELSNAKLLDWIKAMEPRVNRLASVCTGAFLLAESGLLDGCKATTHWHYCQQLAKNYPRVRLEPDHIFVRDGHIFTSGGITSGIDLALAMVEEDWGQELALYVARFLVVFLKRPGGQSQFSSYLTCEASHRPDLRELQTWIMAHTEEDLHVEMLAERMAMSPRNFARLFLAETGMTPAKFVEMARIDQARHWLETTDIAVEAIAGKAGFKDPERMRRAFIRQLGVNPQNYRQRFSKAIAG